jgi:hypothetical protein
VVHRVVEQVGQGLVDLDRVDLDVALVPRWVARRHPRNASPGEFVPATTGHSVRVSSDHVERLLDDTSAGRR